MDTELTVHSAGRPVVVVAGLVGALLAGISLGLSLYFAGSGHGTQLPFYGFFGPVWLLWSLLAGDDPPRNWELGVGFGAMILLYGCYGAVVAVARQRQAGRLAWGACLTVHYIAAVYLYSRAWETLSDFCHVAGRLPVGWVVVLVEYFLLLHLLGFQYAGGDRPFRPRLNWVAASVLLAGLLLSLVCATRGGAG